MVVKDDWSCGRRINGPSYLVTVPPTPACIEGRMIVMHGMGSNAKYATASKSLLCRSISCLDSAHPPAFIPYPDAELEYGVLCVMLCICPIH